MPISLNRAEEIHNYFSANGVDNALNKYHISTETLYRYLRKYRELSQKENQEDQTNKFEPKILILDIETKPLNCWTWGVWKQNISHEQVRTDWMILTWAAKWLNYPEIYSGKVTPNEIKAEDDSRILSEVWGFIDAADIVVAHNGDGFDLVRLNTRFLINGLHPPSPYQSVDTLKVLRRKFAFVHNKLDYVGQILGMGGKLETGGMKLWLKVIDGDQNAINQMEIYNKRDITLLEEVYLTIRSWIPSHPNLGLFISSNDSCCSVCAGTNLEWLDKFYTTQVGKYSVFRCRDCGAIGRSRTTALTKEKRQHLVVSPAR